ncbi:Uncharacterised protein [Klebsiella variicola]|nr:Uncharacterised protein [Klebsiella variicola]
MPRRFRFQAQSRDQGEVPAGAVAGQRDTRGINAKLLCVLVNNRSTSFCIIVRRRKGMLRRQAVLYSDHPATAEHG